MSFYNQTCKNYRNSINFYYYTTLQCKLPLVCIARKETEFQKKRTIGHY